MRPNKLCYMSAAIATFLAALTGYGVPAAAAVTALPCRAHWSATGLPIPPPPAVVNRPVQSAAAVSRSDVWVLTNGENNREQPIPYVYHFNGTTWTGPMRPGGSAPFFAEKIVARSSSDVWVAGISATDSPVVWHYNGSIWADKSPTLSSYALIYAAALSADGTLYVAGSNDATDTGMIWRYSGSQWTDVSPADPARGYSALTVTPSGILVAAGGLAPRGGELQERSGGTWTTVPTGALGSISGVTASPDGTVFAVGETLDESPVLIEQSPGARSARVLAAPAARSASTFDQSVLAVTSRDVWLLGQFARPSRRSHVWITHFNGNYFTRATVPGFPNRASSLAGGFLLEQAVVGYGGATPTTNYATFPQFLAVCPAQVTTTAIQPADLESPLGDQVFWSVASTRTRQHDLSSPGIFNSGPIEPGGSYGSSFFAAGTYRVRDSLSAALGMVGVPLAVVPVRGATSTIFTFTTATIQAPVGYVYRILIERPGADRYTLLTTTSQPATTFIPDAGPGTYRIEAELQTPAGRTAPSPVTQITVS
jgi:hypothetical protein